MKNPSLHFALSLFNSKSRENTPKRERETDDLRGQTSQKDERRRRKGDAMIRFVKSLTKSSCLFRRFPTPDFRISNLGPSFFAVLALVYNCALT